MSVSIKGLLRGDWFVLTRRTLALLRFWLPLWFLYKLWHWQIHHSCFTEYRLGHAFQYSHEKVDLVWKEASLNKYWLQDHAVMNWIDSIVSIKGERHQSRPLADSVSAVSPPQWNQQHHGSAIHSLLLFLCCTQFHPVGPDTTEQVLMKLDHYY